MKITYRKSTGEVVMMGQDCENEALCSVEISDDPKMKQGYRMRIKNGAIEYEKPWQMEQKEKEAQAKADIAKDIAAVQEAKNVNDLKQLLFKIINKINP